MATKCLRLAAPSLLRFCSGTLRDHLVDAELPPTLGGCRIAREHDEADALGGSAFTASGSFPDRIGDGETATTLPSTAATPALPCLRAAWVKRRSYRDLASLDGPTTPYRHGEEVLRWRKREAFGLRRSTTACAADAPLALDAGDEAYLVVAGEFDPARACDGQRAGL